MSARPLGVLIQYFVADHTILTFTIRPEYESPEIIDLGVDLERMRSYCDTAFSGASLRNLDLLDWEEWQRMMAPLMEPVARCTRPGETVWIVPDGFLHGLPLHALVIDGQTLIERNAVCYTPSASTMLHCVRRRNRRRSRLVSFADSRSDLPQARSEAYAIAKSFGVEPCVGKDVTRTNVMRALSASADTPDVVHVACHIEFDNREPLHSGVVLAPDDGAQPSAAARLTALDILDLQLSVDLVLLNGCVSGVSVRLPGDELMGLCRAWLHAGAGSVLATTWLVDDESSRVLLEQFVLNLGIDVPSESDKLTKAEALRQAQIYLMRRTRREFSNPYHWAPFSLIGAPS
jgi:CHAT domain-containing protein